MMIETTRQYTVPRWLYTMVRVPAAGEIRVDPDAFANSTRHRMRLIALSFGAPYEAPLTANPRHVPDVHPSWASRLLVDIGKSGCSDLNLVSGTLDVLCANPRWFRSIGGDFYMPRNWRLPTPYLLPRDEGLRVSVEWVMPQYMITGYQMGQNTSPEITFIAKGYYLNDGYPAMLAGRADPFTSASYVKGQSTLMNSSDLFNRGKSPMMLTEFSFKEMDVYERTDNVTYYWVGHGCNFAWMVNPSNPTFTQFMPQPRHIPTGLLTPLCFSGSSDPSSPRAYYFPKDTFLDPKQAIGIRLGNTTPAENIDLHICLIAEMEVK